MSDTRDTTGEMWTPITRERIRAALEAFVEWETDDRSEVSAQSAAVFVVEMSKHSITIREAAEALYRYGPTVPVEHVVETAYGAALDGDEGLEWRARVLGLGRLRSRGLPLGASGSGAREGWMREEGQHERIER